MSPVFVMKVRRYLSLQSIYSSIMSSKSAPLSVILVSSGSKGDKLLFRYPFNVEESTEVVQKCK